MKFKIIIFFSSFIFILTNCESSQKFAGVWVNNENICDTIFIKKTDNFHVIERGESIFIANEENNILNIRVGNNIINAFFDNERLVYNHDIFVQDKQLDIENFDFSGPWRVVDCNTTHQATIEFENGHASIYFGPPLVINSKTVKSKEQKLELFYESIDGTISIENIKNGIVLNHETPIAEIMVIDKDLIKFIWFGVEINQSNEKWMPNLVDDYFWGNPLALKNGYQVLLIKENQEVY